MLWVSMLWVLRFAGNKNKRLATLEIVITLFKVYFRLNTLRLCKNLINAVNSKQFLPFDSFPASQRVTYKYYTGRLAIFDENYVRSPSLRFPFKPHSLWVHEACVGGRVGV
jgi:hypothetical protein